LELILFLTVAKQHTYLPKYVMSYAHYYSKMLGLNDERISEHLFSVLLVFL